MWKLNERKSHGWLWLWTIQEIIVSLIWISGAKLHVCAWWFGYLSNIYALKLMYKANVYFLFHVFWHFWQYCMPLLCISIYNMCSRRHIYPRFESERCRISNCTGKKPEPEFKLNNVYICVFLTRGVKATSQVITYCVWLPTADFIVTLLYKLWWIFSCYSVSSEVDKIKKNAWNKQSPSKQAPHGVSITVNHFLPNWKSEKWTAEGCAQQSVQWWVRPVCFSMTTLSFTHHFPSGKATSPINCVTEAWERR